MSREKGSKCYVSYATELTRVATPCLRGHHLTTTTGVLRPHHLTTGVLRPHHLTTTTGVLRALYLLGREPREVLALGHDLALLRGGGDLAKLGAADREVVVPGEG